MLAIMCMTLHFAMACCCTSPLLVTLVVVCVISWTVAVRGEPPDKKPKVEHLLDIPGCRIPAIPLINPSVLEEWEPKFDSIQCEQEVNLFGYEPNGTLSLTTLAQLNYTDCCYTEIQRPEQLLSDKYDVSKCIPFAKGSISANLSLEQEFIFVTCFHKQQKLWHKNFQHRLALKPSIDAKVKFWQKRAKPPPVSVMVLLIDSVSRAQAMRGLPKSLALMGQEGFVDFKAQHAMGEPTIENEVPIMLGTVTSDWEKPRPWYPGKYDALPFIWRNFSDSNYVTLDNEDAPAWHTWNFNGRTGFTRKPFDYYFRPYYLAQEQRNAPKSTRTMRIKCTRERTTAIRYNPLVCMEGKPVYDFLFDVGLEFLRVVSPAVVPSFSLNFLSWPQHDYLNAIRILDDPLHRLLTQLRDTPAIYENTVIMIGGDHGFRWANYSDSEEGLLERDLAWLSIRLPIRFRTVYPELSRNMAENAGGRLTSHVDLFKTLAHLHQLGEQEILGSARASEEHHFTGKYGYNRPYGISLLDKIPLNRTCADAKVPKEFCACNYPLYEAGYSYEKFKKAPAVEGLSAIKG